MSPDRLAATEDERGSIIASINALNDPEAKRHCRPLELDDAVLPAPLGDVAELGDPAEPLVPDQILGPSLPLRERRQWRRWVGRGAALTGLLLIAAAWLGPWPLNTTPALIAIVAGHLLLGLWIFAERLWRPGLR